MTIRWTLFTALGLAVGLTAGVLVGIPLNAFLNAMIVTALVVCVIGGVLGGFQAAGLRPLLAKPVWWIAATLVGTGLGLAIGVVTVEQVGIAVTGVRPRVAFLSPGLRALSFVTLGFIAGIVLGLAQWLVLRAQRSAVRHWVVVCGAALGIAFSLASLLLDLTGITFPTVIGRISFVILAGVMFGVLTSWPLRRAAPAIPR